MSVYISMMVPCAVEMLVACSVGLGIHISALGVL